MKSIIEKVKEDDRFMDRVTEKIQKLIEKKTFQTEDEHDGMVRADVSGVDFDDVIKFGATKGADDTWAIDYKASVVVNLEYKTSDSENRATSQTGQCSGVVHLTLREVNAREADVADIISSLDLDVTVDKMNVE